MRTFYWGTVASGKENRRPSPVAVGCSGFAHCPSAGRRRRSSRAQWFADGGNRWRKATYIGDCPLFCGVFLFRQAIISSLPDAVIEAARIDGCGEVRTFFAIALPTVRPMIGAFMLITYLATWINWGQSQ
jgi:hypothetical protein